MIGWNSPAPRGLGVRRTQPGMLDSKNNCSNLARGGVIFQATNRSNSFATFFMQNMSNMFVTTWQFSANYDYLITYYYNDVRQLSILGFPALSTEVRDFLGEHSRF